MIRGIGTDLVFVPRMHSFAEKGGYLKCFTESEIAYIETKINKEETAAGIFAAKEALFKAMGIGMGKVPFKSICVCHDNLGKPYFEVDFETETSLSLSISHDGEYAVAFVVAEKE